jgi:hypothetical protein
VDGTAEAPEVAVELGPSATRVGADERAHAGVGVAVELVG